MFKSIIFKTRGASGSTGPDQTPDDSAMSAMDVSPALAAWDYRVPEAPVLHDAAMNDSKAPSNLQRLDLSAAKDTELHPADNAGATDEGGAEYPALPAALQDIPLAAVSTPREVCVLPPDHKLTGTAQGKDAALAPEDDSAIADAAVAVAWNHEPFLFMLDNEPGHAVDRLENLMQAPNDGCSDCGVWLPGLCASDGFDSRACHSAGGADKAVSAGLAIVIGIDAP